MYNSYQYNTTLYNMWSALRRLVRKVIQYTRKQYNVKFEDGDEDTKHES